jgi:hypothetical protein
MSPRAKALAAVAAALVLGAGGSAGAAVNHHHGGWHGSVPRSEAAWVRDVLTAGHWPHTPANVSSLTTWATREAPWNGSPPDGALYTRNPLNITQGPGETGTVPGTPGVSILPDWRTSVNDTAGRISGGLYDDLAAALASGKGLCGHHQGFATWSGGGYPEIC